MGSRDRTPARPRWCDRLHRARPTGGPPVDPPFYEADNDEMSNSSTTATSTALGFLTTEASLALEQAKKLRDELNALPANDPKREVLEKTIQDLLDRSRRFSTIVTSTASSS